MEDRGCAFGPRLHPRTGSLSGGISGQILILALTQILAFGKGLPSKVSELSKKRHMEIWGFPILTKDSYLILVLSKCYFIFPGTKLKSAVV